MPRQPTRRETLLLELVGIVAVIIFFGAIAIAVAINRPGAQGIGSPTAIVTDVLTPTSPTITYPYLATKMAPFTQEAQTQEAARLTPFPTGTVWSFPPATDTPFPEELTPPPSTPAGAGMIIEDPIPDRDMSKLLGIFIVNKWTAEFSDKSVFVFAGSDYADASQGMVYVTIFSSEDELLPDGGYYLTPIKDGAVRIVNAEGQRLILRSESGTTFYFDVPGQTFVSSLTENVPTATPWPFTPAPTDTPRFSDDVPNDPWDVLQNSPANTNLRYYVNPSGDIDWLRFYLPKTATIQVVLSSLPANYDAYVYSATNPQLWWGSSTKSGKAAETVILANAPSDDYYVLVVGVNGAWDAANPYQLRFNVPGIGGP